ncbi:nuclear transport factor 2 family protein [Lactobacillus sp. Sy-1]|uniref:nuclear transport factor 2 family protein n=1 Tax=Lactobacillus sp. Sy-1 TaxID=2109645 RepID=UPI001C571A71|nr:nuclear transport factor 2 family protein [Lactobacillus sp. Sy-1]MBW1604867.1 nuclear transport factor 2 family protein [Lactobacillus sp. Sy-1]
MAEKETILINLYHQLYQGMINADLEQLDGILANDFILTHMTGVRQSKAEWLAAIKDGSMNYYSEQEAAAQVNGDALTCRNVVDASIYGMRSKWRLQMVLSFVHQAKEWKIKTAIASSY